MKIITDPAANRALHLARHPDAKVSVDTGPTTLGALALAMQHEAQKPSQDDSLEAIEIRKVIAQAKLDSLSRAREKVASDPATKVAEAKLELARLEREAELAAHELAVDDVYRAACLDRGEHMVARVWTREGSLVVRAATEQEDEERAKTVGAHARLADAASSPDDRARHLRNVELEARACYTKLVLSDMAHLHRVAAKFPAVWGQLARVCISLASGRMLVEGKDGGA